MSLPADNQWRIDIWWARRLRSMKDVARRWRVRAIEAEQEHERYVESIAWDELMALASMKFASGRIEELERELASLKEKK